MGTIIELVHIDMIRVGDTVEHEGVLRTVARSDIKGGDGDFMARRLFGDSYRLGSIPVRRATFQLDNEG